MSRSAVSAVLLLVAPEPGFAGPGSASETLDDLRERGARHYESQEYFAAIEAFEAALEKAATDEDRQHVEELLARVRTALGLELLGAGEITQAERAFRRVIELHDDAYARFGLGYVHFLRFEDPQARVHLERATALDRRHARTRLLLALLAYRAGESGPAIKLLEEAARLAPEDGEAQSLLRRWRHELPYAERLVETHRDRRFVIRSDAKIPAGRRRRVLELLERSRRAIGEALAHPGRQPVVVLLFAEEEFHRATGSRHWVGGTYDGRLKLPVPAGEELSPEDASRLESAVRHEVAHVVLRELLPECPGWLNEGIAQHFEHETLDLGLLRERLREGRERRLAFSELPTRLWELEDEELARWTYLQAYGFVEFLVRRFKEFRLRLLIDAVRAEGSLEGAFRSTYGQTLRHLETEWWDELTSSADGGEKDGRADGPTPRGPIR